MTTTIYRRTIPEIKVEGKPLGRHVLHDSRSLAYRVPRRAPTSRKWRRQTVVLDQLDLGSCVGNACAGVLGTEPFITSLSEMISAGLVLDEAEAVKLYSLATQLDPYSGDYPPIDTGSDGLSGAKACQQFGLISGYQHCLSLDDVISAMQDGPVITGVNWYSSFDTPDASGRVTITPGAVVRGGHEFELFEIDIEARMLSAWQSWGYRWGDYGRFYLGFDDYTRLLAEEGDATKFVPITQAAPVPTPTPTNDPYLIAFHDKVSAWASAPHSGSNRKAAAAARELFTKEGLS